MRIHRRLLLGLAAGAVLSTPTLAFSPDEPPSLVGKWTWSWKDANGQTHSHTLELEGTGVKMTGRETADDRPAVKVEALKQEGKSISFAVSRDGRYAEYKGKLTETNSINGLVTVMQGGTSGEYGWTATRKPAEK